jgi:hypothetical protein
MQWYEAEVQALERAIALRAQESRPPVFYGSSSIRLWDTLAEDVDPRVLNLGFGGSTLEACDYFFRTRFARAIARDTGAKWCSTTCDRLSIRY